MNFLSKFKKGISVAFAALALAVSFGTVSAMDYTDASEIPSWANEAISELGAIGVMTGNDDGSFNPNGILNRAEVSKIIVLAADVAIDTTGGAHFPDVAESTWYYDYVETMYNYGWIDGYPNGDFGPGNQINRAEIAKMVVNAFEITAIDNGPSFSDVASDAWFYSYVETVKGHGIMLGYGDGTFAPANLITRAEAAKIVYEGLLVATEVTGPAAGTLEASLSSDTPRGTNIPYNATSVPFTTIELSAADDSDIEVSSITLTRLGLGDNDDFENVWLEIDGFKVGNDRSINNDDVVELRFNPPIVVPAGQTLVADVVASTKFSLASDGTCFDAGSEGCNIGHHNRFAVISADDIVSTAANVVGDFPIEGEEMEVADYQVSQLVLSTLGSDTTVNVGDAFVELGKYRLLNSSTTNKDVELRAITFKNNGTAELANVLENLSLYVSGEQVSAETIIDGDYVTFRLDNGVTGGYVIEDGDSRIFSLRADVVSAEAGDTINFKVDNFEDIVGIEIGTAFGVKTVDSAGNNAEDANATLKTYSIDSGDINVSRDPNSLGNQEYAPGSNDVVAMTARIVVSQPILADGVTLRVDSSQDGATGTPASLAKLNEYFDNFRLYLNDDLIDTENSIDGTTAAPTLTYSSQFEITGASVMKLVMNVQDAAVTDSFVKFSLFATDFDSPEYISSGDTVVEDDLLGSALASKVEVEKSIVTIVRTDDYTSETIVAGVTDATFLEFVMDNNDSGDVNVTSITLKGIGTGIAADNYSNFTTSLFVDGQQIGSSKTLDSDAGTAAFNDIAVTIPSAGQESFVVIVDTIESVATEALAVTTLDNGAGTTTAACQSANALHLTLTGTSTGAGTSDLYVADADGTLAAPCALTDILKVGDSIAVSSDGTNIGTNAEAAVITAINTTTDVITVTPAFANPHLTGEIVGKVNTQYGDTDSITLASVENISEGDIIRITGATGGVATLPYTAEDFCVKTVTGNVVTLAQNDDCVTADTTGTTLSTETAVAEVAGGSKIRMAVVAADVDNAENGSEVVVYEEDIALGDDNTDSTGDGDCEAGTSDNYLCGGEFVFDTTGKLEFKSLAITGIDSKIILGGSKDEEVFKVQLTAKYDEIIVTDLFVQNTSGSDFKGTFTLYNEAGQPLATEQMLSDKVHFDLPNNNRIAVPRNGSTTVTVKVDVNEINTMSNSADSLVLSVDTAATGSVDGVIAETSATGINLEAVSVTPLGGQNTTEFVTLKTVLGFAHATSQPSFSAGEANVAIYRFSASNDAEGEAVLNRLSLLIGASGTTLPANVATLVRYTDAGYTGTGDIVSMSVENVNAGTVSFILGDLDGDGAVDAGESAETIDGATYYEVRSLAAYTASAGDDTVTAKFVDNASTPLKTALTVPVTYVAVADTLANLTDAAIVWSDKSNNGSEGLWINGFELSIPNDAETIAE